MAFALAFLGALALAQDAIAQKCDGAAFLASALKATGIEITAISAEEVKDWDGWATSVPATPALPVQPMAISFCDVQVTYTHPGMDDSIRVDVWLPEKTAWNGRFLGQGGLGWAAGNAGALASGVAMGLATAQTDTGHTYLGTPQQAQLDSSWWGLISPGNVNLNSLQTNGYRGLDDLAVIAKHIIETYYQKPISYSYWNGCSTGGRQGMVLAQKYPKHFDGIISSAPSQNWATFLITEHWAHVKMKELNYYPAPCELNAIRAAVVQQCDELDGVSDNVIAARSCVPDVKKLTGQKYQCGDKERKITKQAVQVAEAVWNGPIRKNGKPVWHGLAHEASLPGFDPIYGGLATTLCDDKNENCKSNPFPISADYIKTWVVKDNDFDLTTVDEAKFYELLHISKQEYHSFLDANEPNLEAFKARGGKMIQWHGLADQLIAPNGSLNYYLRVQEEMGNTDDFYRYFEAPGVAHCFGGDGAFPATTFLALQEWVEKGTAPNSIIAESVPALSSNPTGPSHKRPICPWPKVQRYNGGNIHEAESFVCADDFGKKTPSEEEKKDPRPTGDVKDEL